MGVSGTDGTTLTVSVELAAEIHVGDATSLAVTVWPPTDTPVKVALDW